MNLVNLIYGGGGIFHCPIPDKRKIEQTQISSKSNAQAEQGIPNLYKYCSPMYRLQLPNILLNKSRILAKLI